MRSAALACFLILVPCSLRAQDKKDDWKALYGLRSGEKIELIETDMKKHVGTFSTVTEEAIQILRSTYVVLDAGPRSPSARWWGWREAPESAQPYPVIPQFIGQSQQNR